MQQGKPKKEAKAQTRPKRSPAACVSPLVVFCGGFQEYGFPMRINMILTIGRSENEKKIEKKGALKDAWKRDGEKIPKGCQKGAQREAKILSKSAKGEPKGRQKYKKVRKKDATEMRKKK